jgi:LacI family transcriptional regulator
MNRLKEGDRQSETATQRDVAARAGVSIATVSRVLNGVRTVNPEIRHKVERAIAELRYTPNEVARSLRAKVTNTVGMVAPEIANPFAMEVASGALRVLRDHGYVPVISGSESSVANERTNLQTLVDKRVDGLLVTSVDSDGSGLDRVNRQIPVVLIDYVNSDRLDSVRVDNIEGAFHAVSHLASRGYRRIATIAGPQRYTSDRERLQGFRRATNHYGLDTPESYVRYGDFFVEGGYRQCQRLLDEQPEVDAILAANNLMGIGALKAIRDTGRSIPQEVALCVFDDFLMADMVAPPLTVIAQPTFLIGETAARMLIARMTGKAAGDARQVLLKPELLVRGST